MPARSLTQVGASGLVAVVDTDGLRPELQEFVLALLDASAGLGLEVPSGDTSDESAD